MFLRKIYLLVQSWTRNGLGYGGHGIVCLMTVPVMSALPVMSLVTFLGHWYGCGRRNIA